MPTFAEAGIADMEIELWTGIVAPTGTPAEIVERLQDAIERHDRDAGGAHGARGDQCRSARDHAATEFRELIARDTARWKAVAAKANIKLD